jgi:hypothetical protein
LLLTYWGKIMLYLIGEITGSLDQEGLWIRSIKGIVDFVIATVNSVASSIE